MQFPVILCDPPVPFECWGKRPGGVDSRTAESHYKSGVMTWQGLAALGPAILQAATPDCVLFLWLCHPLLLPTIQMAQSWGFMYKTKGFVWVKLTTTGTTVHTGLGYWTRANSEDVLLFTRGDPHRVRKDVKQLLITLDDMTPDTPAILAPRGRHSQKPEEIQDAIERLVDGPFLEMFARRERKGWTCVGDEVTGNDIRDDLARLAAMEQP